MKLATIIILLLHSIPISIAKGCYCQCSDSPSSPQCTKCIGTDGNCSKFQETCRYYESIHAPNCQNERVINGVYQTKSDCCSDQFISQNFSTSPNYINIRGQVFFKNYNTNLFVLYQPDYPPSIDFPDQSYDNTTCAHRCCRKARMITASNCTSDWKACAVADSNGIPCDANKTIGCSIWIPCDDETNQAFFGGFSFSVLFVIYCCFFVLPFIRAETPYSEVLIAIYILASVIMSSIAPVDIAKYRQWRMDTQVDMDFISYQSCVQYCNGISNDINTVANKYCGDRQYDAFLSQYFAVFPADLNPHLSSTCTRTAGYCDSCYEHRDDWQVLDNTAVFLIIRISIVSTALMVLLFCIRFKMETGFYTSHAVLAMLSFLFMICGTIYPDQLGSRGGTDVINALSRTTISMRNMCIVFVWFDAVYFGVAVFSGVWICGCGDFRHKSLFKQIFNPLEAAMVGDSGRKFAFRLSSKEVFQRQ